MAGEVSEVFKVGAYIVNKIVLEATLTDEEYSGVMKSLLAGNIAKAIAQIGDNTGAQQAFTQTTAKPL